MKYAGFKYKGAYHYLEPDSNCTEQAEFFYTTILSIDPDFSFDTDFLALDGRAKFRFGKRLSRMFE